VSEVDLCGNITSIQLDFHDVRLELSKVELVQLSSTDNADGSAVSLHAIEISLDGFWVAVCYFEAVNVLLESVLLGCIVVSVESTLHIVLDLLSPDSGKGTESTWSVNVSDHADNFHWWTLDNGASVHNILLDNLFTFTTFLILNTVSHACLVAHEGGEMDWFALVILWPVSDATTMVLGSSLWEVGK